MASWSLLPSTKILMWLVLRGGRGGKLPWQWGEVCFGDSDGPQLGEADWEREKQRQLCTEWLLNYINGTLLTGFAARKSDINIFEEEMHGANGDMTVSLMSVLYQWFIKSEPLVLQEGLSVLLLKSWHSHYIWERSCQLKKKYLMKCMLYIHIIIREYDRKNDVLTQDLIFLPFLLCFKNMLTICSLQTSCRQGCTFQQNMISNSLVWL